MAVGLISLKALKQTTKIPKYSWYGLQLLLLAPLRLISLRNGKKNKRISKSKRMSRSRIFHAEEGATLLQEVDDEDDDDEDDDSEDEDARSFIKTTVSEGVVTSQIRLS